MPPPPTFENSADPFGRVLGAADTGVRAGLETVTASEATAPTLELWREGSAVHSARFRPSRPWVIGRSPQCRLRIDDPTVSDKHALVACQESGQWWVYDLLSRAEPRR